MESTGVPTPARVYQDFEPSMEWVPEDDSDTLLVYLPGFAKEQLRVQLRARNLILSGERNLQQNTWSRFRVEFPVSVTCDLNKISAKFEGNILFVRQPKLITPAPKPEQVEKPAAVVAPKPEQVEKPAAVVAPVNREQRRDRKKTAVVAPVLPTPQKPMDESNEGRKTADDKPLPETKPNIENKEEQKDRAEVPKMGLEEKSKKAHGKDTESKTAEGVNENAPDKKTSDWDNMNKKAVYAELDKTTKTALDNYKRAVGVFATKLKTSTNAVNTIVILLVGLVIGIYVSNSFKSWTKA